MLFLPSTGVGGFPGQLCEDSCNRSIVQSGSHQFYCRTPGRVAASAVFTASNLNNLWNVWWSLTRGIIVGQIWCLRCHRDVQTFQELRSLCKVTEGGLFWVFWNIKVLLKQNLSTGSVLNTHHPSIRSGVWEVLVADWILHQVTETHSAGGMSEGETLYRSTVKPTATGTVWTYVALLNIFVKSIFIISVKEEKLSTVAAIKSVFAASTTFMPFCDRGQDELKAASLWVAGEIENTVKTRGRRKEIVFKKDSLWIIRKV